MPAVSVNDAAATQRASLTTTPPHTPSAPVPDTTPYGIKANRNFHPAAAHRDIAAKEMRNRFAEISYDSFLKMLVDESQSLDPGRVLLDTLPPNHATTDALKVPLATLKAFEFKGSEVNTYPHLVRIAICLSRLVQTEYSS